MARDFDGSSGVFNLGNPAALQTPGTALTVHCFIRPDVVGSGWKGVVTKFGSGSTQMAFQLAMHDTNPVFRFEVFNSSGVGDSLDAVTALSVNTWYGIGGVKNGTGAGAIKTYLNGVEDSSGTSDKTINNTTQAFRIGSNGFNELFNGRIAEVAIWAASLSAAEMLALGRGVSPLAIRPVDLRGYWPIWGVASPEPDLSGNGNNATLTGTANAADHAPVASPFPMNLAGSFGEAAAPPAPAAAQEVATRRRWAAAQAMRRRRAA